MNEKLVIQGHTPLKGEVNISGAKNSVLKLMAASILTDGDVELINVPALSDVNVMSQVVGHLGATVRKERDRVFLNTKDLTCVEAPYELVSKMRASFTVLGALLGRYGEARVSLPGGCSIGKRGVDLHIQGLEALGAEVAINHGYVEAKATRLVGTEIHLDIPSVGATENIMLAAVLAEGTTVLTNAAQEPEIIDLANFLNVLGADVTGAGTNEIMITGVSQKDLKGAQYTVVSDRIEASTYMMAAVGTQGDIILNNVFPTHLNSVIHKLMETGARVQLLGPNTLRVSAKKRPKATSVTTQPYPGFPTDLQAPMMSLLAIADGVSILKETIYENRFKHIGELKRMDAQIEQEGNVAAVTGVERLSGTKVKASDLRAGAALVIAGLQAYGQTEIYNLIHLDRGYENLVEKLTGIGASIQRVSDNEEFVPDEATVNQ